MRFFMKKISCFLTGMLMTAILIVGCGTNTPEATGTQPTESNSFSTMKVLRDEESSEQTNETVEQASFSEATQNGEFKVTMLNVGQGLSVLIETDGHVMIYDGGNRGYSSYVVAYLKENGISNVDYLIASHYDEDHIAGLVGVLNTTIVETVIIPQYEVDTAIYRSFITATALADTVLYAKAGNKYSLGNATIDILYSCDSTEKSENDKSTVIKVSYGTFSCILTGDAEATTENNLIQNESDLNCTLYIVGHHGSSSSSSEVFVKAMKPEVAFISVGADNDYGHPTEKTLVTLKANGVAVYRTDMQGIITLFYNGYTYTISTEKEILQEETATDVENKISSSKNTRYVLNMSSMKFHLPECRAVTRIAEYNKEYSAETRDELISEGYEACGICHP